jgi:2,4-dienoyl-CoA reductase-like NADH-dependent reductase (Old Yellow Enzyme family)
MVMLARGFLRNPRWTWDAADALGGDAFVPNQYLRARTTKA